MKRIIKIEITKQEAIEAYRKLNNIPEEEIIEIGAEDISGLSRGLGYGAEAVPCPFTLHHYADPQKGTLH